MGALLLIIGAILFIALALWLAWGASQFSANIVGKLILAGIVLFFFYWVVFGRTNLAEMEFKRLCEKEAGAKVYKTVQLPAQYFTQYELPDFQRSKKIGVSREVAGRYVSINKEYEISKKYRITKATVTYMDFETRDILGVVTTLRYPGASWIPAPGHVSAIECPQTANSDMYAISQKQIFLRSNEINKE